MGKFEDRLIGELLDEHGSGLAVLERPVPPRRSKRPLWMTGGALAVALAAASVLTLTTGSASPAYAVTRNPNGTVTLTLADLTGVAGANEELHKLRVPVRLLPVERDCHDTYQVVPVPPGVTHASHQPFGFTVWVDRIPRGETLVVGAEVSSIRTGSRTEPIIVLVGRGLAKGRPPTCVPYSLNMPGAR